MNTDLTTKAFRTLLPGKSAMVVTYLMKDASLSPLDALRAFYASQTYHALETEASKCWCESPTQIYHDYLCEH